MNYSISYNSVLRLKSLISDYKPDIGYSDLARDIREGIKFTKLVSQHNFLEKLLARGESTPEVIALARRRYSTDSKIKTRFKKEERRIMTFRIKEKYRQIRDKRREWTLASKGVESALSPEGQQIYRRINYWKNMVKNLFNLSY